MLSRCRARLTFANVVSLFALFVALGGGALAASGFVGSDGKISGCVSKTGGLKVLKPGKPCPKHTTRVVWNQRGQRGPIGPTGPTGQRGPQGATGTVNTATFYDKSQSDARFFHGTGSAAKIDYQCVTGQGNACEDHAVPVLVDGLTLTASCNGSVGISVTASTATDGARLGVNLNHHVQAPENYLTSPFDKASPVPVTATSTDTGNGTLVYSHPGGPTVSIALEYGAPPHSPSIVCDLHGTALGVG